MVRQPVSAKTRWIGNSSGLAAAAANASSRFSSSRTAAAACQRNLMVVQPWDEVMLFLCIFNYFHVFPLSVWINAIECY